MEQTNSQLYEEIKKSYIESLLILNKLKEEKDFLSLPIQDEEE